MQDRTAMAGRWRERADELDCYARGLRAEGDPREAEDAEQAAIEYRIAADELEAGARSWRDGGGGLPIEVTVTWEDS